MRCSAIALAAFASMTDAAIEADKVTSLPGFDGTLPSTHYSGYLPTGVKTGSAGMLHYWVIESENNPKTDPVVLWYNGGPGSSSLIGLLTENGQIRLDDRSLEQKDSNGTPKVFLNEYGWSQNATMVYLEQPKGVGFSYCVGKKAVGCVNTDESTAIDGHEFLVNFFKSYPEYSALDFYITGESYAGTYIPMLMDEIDKNGDVPNFKGAMIGNGCWGSDCFYNMTEPEIDYHIFAGHAMIPTSLKDSIDATCTDFEQPSTACRGLLQKSSELAGDFNVYNIYDTCNGDDMAASGKNGSKMAAVRRLQMNLNRDRGKQGGADFAVELTASADAWNPHPALVQGGVNDFNCGQQTAMEVWLKDPAVMAALHVKPDMGGMRYHTTVGDITGVYQRLLPKYRTIIYSGDVDACVPFWGSERFTRNIGGAEKTAWHAWHSNSMAKKGSVVAGYAIQYQDFQFVTVKGAGHMVPTFKPAFAQSMLTKFLANENF